MLRTIHEEICIEDRISSSDLPSKQSPDETALNRHSSLSSSSSQHIKERLEMEDSDSDWDDEASGGNSIGNTKTAPQYLLNNDRFRQQYDFQAQSAQKPNSVGHQSFLERLGSILCNHSAAVDTCDDTSVIVEISSTATMPPGDGEGTEVNDDNNNALNPQNHRVESDTSSENKKRGALQRSQEEHLFEVIMSQKQQLDRLW